MFTLSFFCLVPVFLGKHPGNHTVGYCASEFVSFMNKYVNIFFTYLNLGFVRFGLLFYERKKELRKRTFYVVFFGPVAISNVPGGAYFNMWLTMQCMGGMSYIAW